MPSIAPLQVVADSHELRSRSDVRRNVNAVQGERDVEEE